MIIGIGFFEEKSVAHVELRNLPLTLHMDTIVGAFVVYVVLADVLLDKSHTTIRGPVSVNSEFTNVVATVTLYLIVKDI